MDMHPIPQNVTSFQFKLVGNMTLKQFLYLAVGVGLAYLLFVTAAAKFPIVAWPIIVISALSGVAFAFLPIGSRPLDHWLAAFLKAIYSPTKRTWKKNGKTYRENPLFQSRLVMYLSGTPPSPAGQIPPAPAHIEPLPSKEALGKTVNLAREAQQLQMKIIQTERILAQIKTETQEPTPVPVDYSQQVNKVLSNLQNLVHQASEIQGQIQRVQAPGAVGADPDLIGAETLSKKRVTVIVPPKHNQATLALTTFPNVINGIVKDKTGNYLEAVVAVIYDKEGLPVRALKTNKLGQFTGSTPLPNGTYTLELEKDSFTFDVLQISLTGEILPPIIITTK